MVTGSASRENVEPGHDAAPDLKARLALAGLRGDPEPWALPEAREAGVTPADVAAWQGILVAGAAQLFAPDGPQAQAVLQAERDDLKAQLAQRFAELAVLTRLLEERSRLLPRIGKDQLWEARQSLAEQRKLAAHRLGRLQIRIVSAMPIGLKRRVKRLLARNRA